MPLSEFYVWNGRHITQCCDCKKAYQKRRRNKLGDVGRARRRASYRKNYERTTRPYKLRINFGLSETEYEQILADQHEKCAICGRTTSEINHLTRNGSKTKRLSVDHDHTTGQVRGLLCSNCNKGLGNFQDNPALLAVALEYLQRAASTNSIQPLKEAS